MANYGYSDALDLMVGAGVLLFARKNEDGSYDDWHHLGNCETFDITTDVTTIEKNSSMNKRRELMASVVTAVSISASITMNEYDPYNLALGLFGQQAVTQQTAQTFTSYAVKVKNVPGLIHLVDNDGNSYYKVTVNSIRPATTVNATASFITPGQGYWASGTYTTNTVINDTYTDADGNSFVLDGTGYSAGGTGDSPYIEIATSNTATGDTAGLVIRYHANIADYPGTSYAATGGSATEVITFANGVKLTVTAGTSAVIPTTPSAFANLVFDPPVVAYEADRDYFLDEQFLRNGDIQIPATSRIAPNDVVLVDFSTEGNTYVSISAANAGEIEGMLRYIGDNNIGPNYVVEGWKVKITPDGSLGGLIGTEFGSFNLTAKFESDYQNHPKWPYAKVTQVDKRGSIYAPLN